MERYSLSEQVRLKSSLGESLLNVTLRMQTFMFNKAHPKEFHITQNSALDFGTAIGTRLGVFSWFVHLIWWISVFCFILFLAYYQLHHVEYWQWID